MWQEFAGSTVEFVDQCGPRRERYIVQNIRKWFTRLHTLSLVDLPKYRTRTLTNSGFRDLDNA